VPPVARSTAADPGWWRAEDLRPVMVGVSYFQQLDVLWGQIMAYSTLITIPVLAFFLAFQRTFVSSIASAGVKG
jgi:multiple sugar transport system permease protein